MKISEKTQPFIIGGISGMTATCIIQPIDMIKVRIQIKNEFQQSHKLIQVIQECYKQGGIRQFYKGLDSALTRQLFYTTSRLGIYKTMSNKIKEKQSYNLMFYQKAYCSITAGFIASLIANPADLVLIRMQNDTTLAENQQRAYGNFFRAIQIIQREDGLSGLWRGCTPTVIRAMALNLGMLAPYDHCKELINQYLNVSQQNNNLMSSAIAGLLAAGFSLPFDNAKTKMQKMIKNAQGQLPYKNIVHCISTTIKNEGVMGLWVGFSTYYVRIAPHAMITLLIQDYLTFKFSKPKKL